MKYIKTYENIQLNKYAIYRGKENGIYYIIKIVDQTIGKHKKIIQLYHISLEKTELVKDSFSDSFDWTTEDEYEFLFDSNNLDECIENIQTLYNINKYNI